MSTHTLSGATVHDVCGFAVLSLAGHFRRTTSAHSSNPPACPKTATVHSCSLIYFARCANKPRVYK